MMMLVVRVLGRMLHSRVWGLQTKQVSGLKHMDNQNNGYRKTQLIWAVLPFLAMVVEAQCGILSYSHCRTRHKKMSVNSVY